MPRNKGIGGNKSRRGKNKPTFSINKNNIIKKDEYQMYARVLKMLGSGRLNALCDDGKERLCKIRGSMMKKVFINIDNIILVSIRDFEDDKCDVIHKYNDEEAKILCKDGEIPSSLMGEIYINKNDEKENDVDMDFNISSDDNSD